MSEGKIINDPVFGFIKVPGGILMDIVNHPLMQRLRHIKQVGLASVVYPGAQHTRFQHSLGAYHLMSEAVVTLTQKGIFIFDSEAEAVKAAILMHDIGHGPFSHVLEHTLVDGISHEDVSLLMMERINQEMGGGLNLALNIFKNEYPKRFLHQLISSQLDMDRLDYLRRDSFYTGVSEGNIGSARIIKMLNVVEDRLVVDSKGIYSIENYLTSRRLMYWQVYLHKTTVATEKMLVNLLLRAKHLMQSGKNLFATPSLRYFLVHHVDAAFFSEHPEALNHYSRLDDTDIYCSIKEWVNDNDKVLSLLASNVVNRRPFKVEVHENPIDKERIAALESELMSKTGTNREEVKYLYQVSAIEKDMYDVNDDHITILYKDGQMKDIAEASEILNVSLLSKKIRKYFLCYHKI
ncbi:MAG: HD domain-containing protein [Prevotella sp.]|nr:HD domain-containing protein [Prevotella sp.]